MEHRCAPPAIARIVRCHWDFSIKPLREESILSTHVEIFWQVDDKTSELSILKTTKLYQSRVLKVLCGSRKVIQGPYTFYIALIKMTPSV